VVDPLDLPNDENGDVLRRMAANGDALTAAREIDFEHVFETREAAAAFLADVASRGLKARLSRYEAKSMWDVRVTRHMVPTHADISRLEMDLDEIAKKYLGRTDGWGCLEVV
jgi:hypothetical protein